MTLETFSNWHRIIRAADTPYLQRLIEDFAWDVRHFGRVGDPDGEDSAQSLLQVCETEMEKRRDSYTGEIDS